MFGHHAQPEILEHGQDVGDGDRVSELQDAQPQAALFVAAVRAQIDLRSRRVRRQRFEVDDVVERLRGLDVGAIRSGEHARVARRQFHGVTTHAAGDQRLLQPVFPGGRRGSDGIFDGSDIFHGRRALRRAHQQVQPGEHGIRDLHLAFHVGAREAIAHDSLDTFAHFGVVAVARHEHEAGVETLIAVTPDEQAHSATFVQIDDAAHDGDEFGGRSLKKLVARKRLDDIDHGLRVVALRGQAEVRDHRIELAAEQGNFRGRLVVGARSPQAEESVFTRDLAFGVEGLDAHVVQVAAAMHGGGRVGLGQHQQFRRARLSPQMTREHDGRRWPASGLRAQDAEPAAAVADQRVARAATLESVVAVSQEHEMPVVHPGQQRARLAGVRTRHG